MTKLDMLNAQRAKKFTALCALVARDLGYGDLPDLSEADHCAFAATLTAHAAFLRRDLRRSSQAGSSIESYSIGFGRWVSGAASDGCEPYCCRRVTTSLRKVVFPSHADAKQLL